MCFQDTIDEQLWRSKPALIQQLRQKVQNNACYM